MRKVLPDWLMEEGAVVHYHKKKYINETLVFILNMMQLCESCTRKYDHGFVKSDDELVLILFKKGSILSR